MAVAAHLGIKLAEYDVVIRTLIPHYQDLLDEAGATVDAVAGRSPTVVDLGTGSGALAQQILAVRPKAHLIGIDEDPAILSMAQKRLRGRLDTIAENFERARIPRCDVISGSFSLHHVRTPRRKAALYARCFAALRPGGLIVSADCCLASTEALQRRHRAAWLAHLQKKYTRTKAHAFLRAWAKEDVYFTLEEEMELMTKAGFRVDVTWRRDSFAVIAGRRARARRSKS